MYLHWRRNLSLIWRPEWSEVFLIINNKSLILIHKLLIRFDSDVDLTHYEFESINSLG